MDTRFAFYPALLAQDPLAPAPVAFVAFRDALMAAPQPFAAIPELDGRSPLAVALDALTGAFPAYHPGTAADDIAALLVRAQPLAQRAEEMRLVARCFTALSVHAEDIALAWDVVEGNEEALEARAVG